MDSVKVVEAAVAGILPVELLVVALQEAELAEKAEFRLGREGDVNAGRVVDPAQFDQAGHKRAPGLIGLRARPDQEPRSGRRRKRHRDLQFRVIAAAGMGIGFGPAGVEHVFAARMAFEIARRGGESVPSGAVTSTCWTCQPVRPPTDFEVSRAP